MGHVRLGATVTIRVGETTWLEIYLQQHVREVGPRIVIGQRPTGEPRIHLLPDEARHLGEALIRLASMADDDSQLVKCEPCDQHEA
jgi:hypothetical protein